MILSEPVWIYNVQSSHNVEADRLIRKSFYSSIKA